MVQLWHAYLRERQLAVRGLAINHPEVANLNNTYERSLVSMHKMPRIWLEYLVSLFSVKNFKTLDFVLYTMA